LITAVDSNVLLDILVADPHFGPAAKAALGVARTNGRLVACDVVWAEVTGFFASRDAATEGMRLLGAEFDPLTLDAALEAGKAWKTYRARGGPRSRITSDFLIGAHAMHQTDRLLTRDDGFYRTYFKHLSVFHPGRK
jgi:predicted nucleic acid-binding protein